MDRFDWLSDETIELLGRGVALTIALTVITGVLATIVGVGIGTARLSPNRRLRLPAAAYTEVFRNVPALIQIIFWAFAVPGIVPADVRADLFFDNAVMDALRSISGIPIPYYGVAACLALVLNTSAYIAELFRAGVGTIPVEQLDASRTLGASRLTAFRTVLLPGGLRAAFPALSTRLIHNMKNTALVSFVAVPEFFSGIQASVQETFRATEFLFLGAVVYLGLAALMGTAFGVIDRRLHRARHV